VDLNFIFKIVIGILVIVTFFQVIRLIELSSRLAGNKDEVTDKSNKINGILLFISGFALVAFFFWQRAEWGYLTLQDPASEHGVLIDQLWHTTMGLIIIIFVILQPMLFGFSFLYRGRKKRKAYFISHNNKLEIFWTAIPTVVLSVLIVYGLIVWGNVTNINNAKGGILIEVYAKQFNWTARYAGEDNKLGDGHVRFYAPTNPLGVVTDNMYKIQSQDLDGKIKSDKEKLLTEKNIGKQKNISDRIDRNIAKQKMFKAYYNSISEKERLAGEDDIVVAELYLPVNQKVAMKFRSQDVIHSAYMPHFRAQMNCVPGLSTQFVFTPTKTTEEMRKDPAIIKQVSEANRILEEKGQQGNVEFDYSLLCNKICGNAHYNMKMKIVVVTQEEYDLWLKEQGETRMIKNM
tara:strand:+ start:643 stop:1854 length:1212 start_codon:yes stop_codon:yes gene_type:complete